MGSAGPAVTPSTDKEKAKIVEYPIINVIVDKEQIHGRPFPVHPVMIKYVFGNILRMD